MRKIVYLFCLISINCFSQASYHPITALPIYQQDDVIVYVLPTIVIEENMPNHLRKKLEQWNRLKYNVRKVYPYAILASAKLRECEARLKTIPNEKDKKKYLNKFEKELQAQFSDELKKLTITQGRILIKLIDRETGNTSYELVKQLRGNFSAFMWQGLARIFGSNLKSEYDAGGDDKMIEAAISQIESGQ